VASPSHVCALGISSFALNESNFTMKAADAGIDLEPRSAAQASGVGGHEHVFMRASSSAGSSGWMRTSGFAEP